MFLVFVGRGKSGKSTLAAEAVWRARSAGRDVVVADGDLRSGTLSKLFPDATVPATEEMPDMKAWLSGLLNRMAKEGCSVVVDLGAGDRALVEFGRDLRLVDFCRRRGIDAVALYVMGPEDEDLQHCAAIWSGGHFRPERSLVVLNEGVSKGGSTVLGSFTGIVGSEWLKEAAGSGAISLFVRRLACMDLAKGCGAGFYAAASGGGGLDPVEETMLDDWLRDLEDQRSRLGVADWLP